VSRKLTDALTDFERELLEAVSVGGWRFGVATDIVDEELLEVKPAFLLAASSRPDASAVTSLRSS
jgi:hypothetical protein